MQHMAKNAMKMIQSRPMGMRTGLKSLDEYTGGLVRGGYNVIAARPSMGKTALMMQILVHMTAVGQKGIFYSIETGDTQLNARMVCNLSKVPLKELYAGNYTVETKAKIQQGLKKYYGLSCVNDFDPFITPAQLYKGAKEYKDEHGLDIVFIDYLQIMRPNEKSLHGQLKVAHLSQELKAIGKELDVVMVILSQLNRGNEAREDRRPRLSDMRDSGTIEQDADMVWLLHREDYYREREETHPQLDGVCEVIIAKNKQGQCGTINLGWQPEFFYLYDC
jgi:replicative DNA helicase